MHYYAISLRLLILISASTLGSRSLSAEEKLERRYGDRVESTPDFPQWQKALPGNGKQYCAPVSASNGLAWLAKQGYPKLMPTDQVSVARKLGSPAYMNTSLNDGTGVTGVALGLKKYVTDRGYQVKDLAYQGWRSIKKRSVRRIPGHSNPVRIGNGLQKKGVVLLNVGFYIRDGAEYERIGGHWVTLVAFERGDTPILIVHDPASRSPKGVHERVSTSRIRNGKLLGSKRGLPTNARGAWELGGELKIKKNSDANTAILDGAVLLRLQ